MKCLLSCWHCGARISLDALLAPHPQGWQDTGEEPYHHHHVWLAISKKRERRLAHRRGVQVEAGT